jgi:serine/threonine-protein kinase
VPKQKESPPALAFGRYQVVAELGKGAMGLVYKARDPMLERTVAIKTVSLSMDPGERAEYEERFNQEARAAGGLNHPNIVTIYDAGKSGPVAFMAMEFLEGREVRAMVAGGKAIPAAQAVNIAAQVAEGLSYAHEHEVIHRDIKPANIMVVRDGLAKIMDFGIARMRSGDVRTQTGVVLGSPKYMSPEQVQGKRADQRSDIFSLGVVLYEMLTGKAPFEGENMTAIMLQTLNFNPDPPSRINPALPEILDFIVAKALAKRPDDRYACARDMASDLRECEKALRGEANAQLIAPRRIQSVPATLALRLEPEAALGEMEPPRSRRSDAEEGDTAPALPVSRIFDSMDATRRLAAAVGLEEEVKDSPPTAAGDPGTGTLEAAVSYKVSDELPQPTLMGWRPAGMTRRQKVIVVTTLGAALAIAALMIAT